eukprot:TRINITY_DN5812_c0_g1_i1.p1 TRINITY_DN5812_c0_g1~~TRINITY_DN5812_c0_g1_i1.p1  ORF type:complete len:803 (+),score=217.54 TRINITY_DN5812_c0_g1_i1:85-2493(+)
MQEGPGGAAAAERARCCVVLVGEGAAAAASAAALSSFGAVTAASAPAEGVAFVRFADAAGAAACLAAARAAPLRVNGRPCRALAPSVSALRIALAAPRAAAAEGWCVPACAPPHARLSPPRRGLDVPAAVALALELSAFVAAGAAQEQAAGAAVAAAVAAACSAAGRRAAAARAATAALLRGGGADAAEALLLAFDDDGDRELSFAEFRRMCEFLGMRPPRTEAEFREGCAALGAAAMTEQAVRSLAEGQLKAAADDIWAMVAAERAERTVRAERPPESVCPGKDAAAAAAVPHSPVCDLAAIGDRLERIWREKGGDVVDELLQNLAVPAALCASSECTLAVLAALSAEVDRRAAGRCSGRNRAELLVMHLYTMSGPDMDEALAFPDTPPPYDKDPAAWQRYRDDFPERNAPIFSTVNTALREAAADPAGDTAAWGVLRKWVKVLGLLHALAATGQAAAGGDLYRGLAGLPQKVWSMHKDLAAGDRLDWAAFSSCAASPAAAENYVAGRAANAVRGDGGCCFFTVGGAVAGCGFSAGIDLQAVSKYPGETEVLLPALSSFAVRSKVRRRRVPPDCVCARAEYRDDQRPALTQWVGDCLADGRVAALRLTRRADGIAAAAAGVRRQLSAPDGAPRWVHEAPRRPERLAVPVAVQRRRSSSGISAPLSGSFRADGAAEELHRKRKEYPRHLADLARASPPGVRGVLQRLAAASAKAGAASAAGTPRAGAPGTPVPRRQTVVSKGSTPSVRSAVRPPLPRQSESRRSLPRPAPMQAQAAASAAARPAPKRGPIRSPRTPARPAFT